MRVLLLNARLSDRGGADRWLLGVLARLQGEVETLLAVGHVRKTLPDMVRERVGTYLVIKGLDRSGLGRPAGQATLAHLAKTIGRFAPDVVHANDIVDPGLLEMIAATGRGMLTVQDHRFFCPGRGKIDPAGVACHEPMGDGCLRCFDDQDYGRTMLELTSKRLAAAAGMRRITVLSRYMSHELVTAGMAAERIVCIPPFADNLETAPGGDPSHDKLHLMAGRLSEHKGVRVALEAAERLSSNLPLVIAGAGPLAEEVSARACTSKRVSFVDWADRTELSRLLGSARSLWLPSLWAEPFGIAGLEALASGVPVIASRVGGVMDWLVDEQNGLLVEPGSAQDLASAADRLAADPALARKLGSAGRRQVRRGFDPQCQMDLLMEAYSLFRAPSM